MKSTVANHRDVALAACAATVPLLREARLNDVAAQLDEITSLALSGDDETVFAMARKLPQGDIADFWDPLDWDLEDQLPLERRALITAYYWATWRALVNWRVAKSYDFDREVVDVEPRSLATVAEGLLAQQKARHAQPNPLFQPTPNGAAERN
ncbi:hypothetical protein, partial [Pelomonas sp. KK5]|uniref:hypothetical protein n=1 Tax=Pelomonas sp. KK5 TaxID=1855730 RepID=UPI00117F5F9F